MPFTFLPHQAPVVPLKMAAPRWFDGTALVVGSIVPDLVFLLDGTPYYVDAHTVPPQLWFCLPVTLVLTWLTKRVVAGPLGAHLPDLGSMHLRDWARLSAWRVPRRPRGLAIMVVSALIGSFSHIGLDQFSHGYGWVPQHVDWLQTQVMIIPNGHDGHPVYAYDLLQVGLTVVGAAITLFCIAYIGRRRMVRTWYPRPYGRQPTTASWIWLVGATMAGVAVGLVLAAATLDDGPRHAPIFRLIDPTLIGLGIGCAVAGLCMRPVASGPADGAEPTATAAQSMP